LFGGVEMTGRRRRNGRIILQELLERTVRLLSYLYDTDRIENEKVRGNTPEEITEEYTDRWTQADTQTAR
jgi:hypothetical protein